MSFGNRTPMRSALSGLLLISALALAGSSLPANAQPVSAASGPFAHIFFIVMENESSADILGNTADAPYFNSLVAANASATNFYGVTHPSLPNYLALLSGSFQGVWDDCAAGASVTCAPQEFSSGAPYNGLLLTPDQVTAATKRPHLFGGQTLVDQLESRGLTWKAYMESMPSVGYTGEYYPVDTVGGKAVPRKLYAQKHNPFVYFSSIRNNPARMEKVVPFTQFDQDLASNQVPNFAFISPNQCNDMHGLAAANAKAVGIPNCAAPDSGAYHGPIHVGDNYLREYVGKIEASAAWKEKAAIVIAFDENDYSSFEGCCHSPIGLNGITLGGGRAPFLVLLSRNPHRTVFTAPANHYSFLATLEKLWGLGCLNEACAQADSALMTPLFQ